MRTLTTKLCALLCAVLIGFHADAAKIEISKEIAYPLQEITVTVMMEELPDVTTSIEGSLTWDENLITLVEATEGILPEIRFNDEENEQLSFSWFDGDGVELVGTNELMSLTFVVVDGATGRARINFSDDPVLEIADAIFIPVSLDITEGYIDILDDLPVELSAFGARATNENIALTWATESEINFEGFEVQRSVDGSNFESIAWLDARGNEAQGANYGYTDSDAAGNKTHYYRLQMRDFDGTFEYSDVVSVRIGVSNPVLEVFPNPAYNEVALVFENFTEMNAPVFISINDNMGRLVKQLQYTTQAGKNMISLNVNHLSTGLYTIRLEQGAYFATRKLIVR